MKILLVCPEFPPTFWGFRYALQFTDSKVAFPPLGLLTVASMLPSEWEKKLVDLNLEPLEDKHLKWADYVFLTGMDVQKNSAIEVVNRCNKLGVKVVAGGPFFTEHYEDFEHVDHLVLGEAETTLPMFLKDLGSSSLKHIYVSDEWPDIEKTPPPMWEIADMKKYATLCIQYSRGCPFDCEFCSVTKFLGPKVRTKSKEQLIEELDSIYSLGWRGGVLLVDDNFIGNKHKLKTEILPAITEWMEKRRYPFCFSTEASINLADDEELMRMMARAGFFAVFMGIESVDDDCLAEAGKFHNRNRDLVANVKKIQRFGLEVLGSFIVGFDSDKESVFDRIAQFIQKSGITIAAVAMLKALRGTKLYARLEKEKRLIPDDAGGKMDIDYDMINFIPRMNVETLRQGYKKILRDIYSPEPHYLRILTFLRECNPSGLGMRRYNSHRLGLGNIYSSVKSLVRIMIVLGIFDEGRVYYWKLFFWSLLKRPRLFPNAMTLWVQGYHFRKVFKI